MMNTDTKEIAFFFILSQLDTEFTMSNMLSCFSSNTKAKHFDDYEIEALVHTGVLAGWLTENNGKFKLTKLGQRKAYTINKEELRMLACALLDTWKY